MGCCWSGPGSGTVSLLASQTLHLARTTITSTNSSQARDLRKLIMHEMVEQERGYISSMDTLVTHFINPMVAMETAVPRDLVITPATYAPLTLSSSCPCAVESEKLWKSTPGFYKTLTTLWLPGIRF